MAGLHIELTFYETYYFANIVNNLLEDPVPYVRGLHDFYGDGRYQAFVAPFRKYSALHEFIEFIIDSVFDEDATPPPKSALCIALRRFGVAHTPYSDWLKGQVEAREAVGDDIDDDSGDDGEEYYEHLRNEGSHAKLLRRATREVFFVLFQNRRVLLRFNELMAGEVHDNAESEDPEFQRYFAKPGRLKRTQIPQWAQKAVFFRDRGRCVLCLRDLSGLLNVSSQENYDHIVPLMRGGLNDVSNLQLLCQDCNQRKRDSEATTSDTYEAWYPDGDA